MEVVISVDSNITRANLVRTGGQTAEQICGVMGSGNPFITCILPLAHADSLVMHSVLALSGAHLIHRANNDNLRYATWTHYALAIRGLKESLTKIRKVILDEAEVAQMLAATLLLCHIEAVSGNVHGAIFHHLRASRHFALALLKKSKAQFVDGHRAFLIELYAYLALVSNVTLNLGSIDRSIPFDGFLSSLESIGENKSFGPMFGCAHGIFQLIPRVCQLGYQRRLDQQKSTPSTTTDLEYVLLEEDIENWEPEMERYGTAESPNHLLAAGQIYQYALLTFLHASYYGSDVTNATLLKKADILIERLFQLIKERRWQQIDQPKRMPAIATTLLWPYIIMGSCMREPEHQIHIRTMLLRSPFEMTIVSRALQILEWLWVDSSEYAYGPYGLEIIMKKYGVNMCMA
ncbi:hypothetical protein EG329_012107 [Mollisiaceae sp. DMI_Dod_QoI]|nr:hypothetical protein EG329_012107 [Helotiales sp. DMI_Dod_QoI]